MDSQGTQQVSVTDAVKPGRRSARRRRQPYAWLSAVALTLGVGVALAGAGTAQADDSVSVDSSRSASAPATAPTLGGAVRIPGGAVRGVGERSGPARTANKRVVATAAPRRSAALAAVNRRSAATAVDSRAVTVAVPTAATTTGPTTEGSAEGKLARVPAMTAAVTAPASGVLAPALAGYWDKVCKPFCDPGVDSTAPRYPLLYTLVSIVRPDLRLVAGPGLLGRNYWDGVCKLTPGCSPEVGSVTPAPKNPLLYALSLIASPIRWSSPVLGGYWDACWTRFGCSDD